MQIQQIFWISCSEPRYFFPIIKLKKYRVSINHNISIIDGIGVQISAIQHRYCRNQELMFINIVEVMKEH